MTEVGFYQLTRTSLEDALPRLLQRILKRGWRCVLRAPTWERLGMLDRHLWTFDKGSFVPHGSKSDGLSAHQPIFLTTAVERPNGAQALVLVDAAPLDDAAAFERVFDIFDGRDPESLSLARDRWRRCRELGYALQFWVQAERGGWNLAKEAAKRHHDIAGEDVTSGPSLDPGPSVAEEPRL